MQDKLKISEEALKQAVADGLSHRKLAKKFDCAVMTVRRALEKYNLKTGRSENSRECKHCGKPLIGHQQYFCSSTCKGSFYYKNNEKARLTKCHDKTQKGLNRKKELVDYLGGKCEKCGYNKNYASLTFHHKDITTKSFPISGRNLTDKPLETLYLEVDKCILLCHNCHSELHYPHLDYNTLATNNFIIN